MCIDLIEYKQDISKNTCKKSYTMKLRDKSSSTSHSLSPDKDIHWWNGTRFPRTFYYPQED